MDHKVNITVVSAIPDEVDAGSKLLFKVRAWCQSGCDLLGTLIRIMDAEGETVSEVDLSLFKEDGYETEGFTIKVPHQPGRYTWKVLYLPQTIDGIVHQENCIEFSFQVKPHRISLSVWGISSPVSIGGIFKVNIGAKCSAGCSLAGLSLVVEDEEKRPVANGHLGEEILPLTQGTYFTEQELTAPTDEGLYRWNVTCDLSSLEYEHIIEPVNFLFRTTIPPENTVTVKVTDINDGNPLQGANIAIGIYKGTTDAQGIATLQVHSGKQKLYVVKENYISFSEEVEIFGDTMLDIPLEFSPLL